MSIFRRLFDRHRIRPAPVPEMDPPDLSRLQNRIGYTFLDASLLTTSLIHRSFTNTEDSNSALSNERLEFLGDAVLNVSVSEYLYHRYPERQEGELTKIKSLIVSRTVLAEKANALRLGQHLLLGPGEEQSGGRSRSSILADAFEALLGAIYLDGGENACRSFLATHLLADLDRLVSAEEHTNYKSLLLEYCQAQGKGQPVYTVIKERGPDHDKEFTIKVTVAGSIRGKGVGRNKREAEQQAAREASEKIGARET